MMTLSPDGRKILEVKPEALIERAETADDMILRQMICSLFSRLTATTLAPVGSIRVYESFLKDISVDVPEEMFDTVVDTMAYFALKSNFKDLLLSNMGALNSVLANINKL